KWMRQSPICPMISSSRTPGYTGCRGKCPAKTASRGSTRRRPRRQRSSRSTAVIASTKRKGSRCSRIRLTADWSCSTSRVDGPASHSGRRRQGLTSVAKSSGGTAQLFDQTLERRGLALARVRGEPRVAPPLPTQDIAEHASRADLDEYRLLHMVSDELDRLAPQDRPVDVLRKQRDEVSGPRVLDDASD